jgi:hypothetical protein
MAGFGGFKRAGIIFHEPFRHADKYTISQRKADDSRNVVIYVSHVN